MSNKIVFCDLQNFQGHIRTRVPLEDFNIIIGQSSAGKSSILRALRWLFYGEWDETYPNDKSKPTACAITLDSGTRILRIRDGNSNQAMISANGETVKYKSFGAIIPGLRQHLNLEPIEIGNSTVNLNFSLQDDPIFMVNETKPNKAQWIGRLYGAHIINEMLRDMAKDKKNIDAKRKDKEQEIDKLVIELGQYKNLEEQENLIKEVDGIIDQLDYLSGCHSESLIIGTYKSEFDKNAWVSKIDLSKIKEDIFLLSKLKELNREGAELKDLKKSVGKYGIIDVDYLNDLRNDIMELQELFICRQAMADMQSQAQVIKTDGPKIKRQIASIRSKIEKHVVKDGLCPVCGGDASTCADRVVKNIKRIASNGI